jgi:hypothetical protein
LSSSSAPSFGACRCFCAVRCCFGQPTNQHAGQTHHTARNRTAMRTLLCRSRIFEKLPRSDPTCRHMTRHLIPSYRTSIPGSGRSGQSRGRTGCTEPCPVASVATALSGSSGTCRRPGPWLPAAPRGCINYVLYMRMYVASAIPRLAQRGRTIRTSQYLPSRSHSQAAASNSDSKN